jgi:hypothetical protein
VSYSFVTSNQRSDAFHGIRRLKTRTSNLGSLATLALLGLLGGIAATAGGDEEADFASRGGTEGRRIREGTVLTDQPGTFQLVGKRLVFAIHSDGRQLGALENLTLERVVRLMQQTAVPQTWLVSGTVTEYQGTNYLLIDRAVLHRTGATKALP